MEHLDTREWLLTNGLGGFASGTICDAHTRTYHGWLFAALEPPGKRTLLLSRFDAELSVGGQITELNTNFWESGAIAPKGYELLRSIEIDPLPTWVWGTHQWQLSRQLLLPYGCIHDPIDGTTRCLNRVLVRYHYHGQAVGILKLRPLIGDRSFHHQQHDKLPLKFSQLLETRRLLLQARSTQPGTPWQISWTQGDYAPEECWYWGYRYPEETRRGLGDTEDLFSPGYWVVALQPGETVTFEAKVRGADDRADEPLDEQTFDREWQHEQQRLDQSSAYLRPMKVSKQHDRLWQRLLRAGDQFIAHRQSISGPTVIAGYHWFSDWGRDTLIALPGLALATQRFSLARGLLETFGRYCQDGLLPNTFPDTGAKPCYNSLDAVLWWIEALGLYLEATHDWEFLQNQYPIVRRVYKSLTAGTDYNIRLDAFDGLLMWDAPGVALTWMDVVVDGQPVTPRRGKPIEICALWYSALCWATQWAQRLQQVHGDTAERYAQQAERYAQQASQVKLSLQTFWNGQRGYLYDVIEPNDHRDGSIRPNAVIALSLHHCAFSPLQGQQVLAVARDRLLTPYGLRSLDPSAPYYVGNYEGGVGSRDRAYHQGTVWSWLLGPFIRAWKRFYPEKPLPIDWQPLLDHFQHQACVGSVSEIFDGDFPHAPKGAIAQAWSVAELIRHWDDVIPEELV